ncbi:unknown [Ruminococcus sp. CAG:60]|nr:unknown [Ruminococcus sp. CAG:60]
MGAEVLQVAGQGGAIAAYVDHSVGLHFDDGGKEGLVTTFAGRIHYDHIGALACASVLLRQNLFGFSYKEFCIGKAVQLGVFFGILNSCRNNLHASYHLRLLCQEQGNGSDSAVKIPYGFITGKVCVFQCLSIKPSRLVRIYLEKGQRRNLIGNLPNLICNVRLAPKQPHCFPKDHVISLLIHIHHHTYSLRNFPKGFHKSVLPRKLLPVDDQTDHHLICEKAVADQHMAHQPFACVLVIGLNMVLFHVGDHTVQHLFILGNSKSAVPVLNNAVSPSCIKSGNNSAVL